MSSTHFINFTYMRNAPSSPYIPPPIQSVFTHVRIFYEREREREGEKKKEKLHFSGRDFLQSSEEKKTRRKRSCALAFLLFLN